MDPAAGPAPDQSRRAADFRALYERYYERVLGYVLRRTPREAAHDVVAEIFLVVWRRFGDLPQEPLPWLLGIARKILANERRSARRRASLLNELRATHHVAGGEGEDTPSVADVVAALERLPERDQELLKLVAWDGLTLAEAAAVVGRSPATTRVRLHRARRRLGHELRRGASPGRYASGPPFPSLVKEQNR